jgi:hypothetical protein
MWKCKVKSCNGHKKLRSKTERKKTVAQIHSLFILLLNQLFRELFFTLLLKLLTQVQPCPSPQFTKWMEMLSKKWCLDSARKNGKEIGYNVALLAHTLYIQLIAKRRGNCTQLVAQNQAYETAYISINSINSFRSIRSIQFDQFYNPYFNFCGGWQFAR